MSIQYPVQLMSNLVGAGTRCFYVVAAPRRIVNQPYGRSRLYVHLSAMTTLVERHSNLSVRASKRIALAKPNAMAKLKNIPGNLENFVAYGTSPAGAPPFGKVSEIEQLLKRFAVSQHGAASD